MSFEPKQMEMICLEDLAEEAHQLRSKSRKNQSNLAKINSKNLTNF